MLAQHITSAVDGLAETERKAVKWGACGTNCSLAKLYLTNIKSFILKFKFPKQRLISNYRRMSTVPVKMAYRIFDNPAKFTLNKIKDFLVKNVL